MKILVSLVALLVGLTACGTAATPSSQSHGSSTSGGASTGAAASPGGSSGALFAVLEGAAPNVSQANTVAIVALDGYAVAKARFLPRKGPYVPMAATMPQSEAQVGAGGVYYIDGNGAVRLLKRSGQPSAVATFPITPTQHEVWYAVKPDGRSVLAGVLTLPAVASPSPGTDL